MREGFSYMKKRCFGDGDLGDGDLEVGDLGDSDLDDGGDASPRSELRQANNRATKSGFQHITI